MEAGIRVRSSFHVHGPDQNDGWWAQYKRCSEMSIEAAQSGGLQRDVYRCAVGAPATDISHRRMRFLKTGRGTAATDSAVADLQCGAWWSAARASADISLILCVASSFIPPEDATSGAPAFVRAFPNSVRRDEF